MDETNKIDSENQIIKFHPLFIKFPHPYVEVGILIHCPTFWGSWANFMRFFIHDAISSNVFLKEMGASSFNFHHQMLSIPYIFINFATSFSTFILIDFQPLWNSLQGLNQESVVHLSRFSQFPHVPQVHGVHSPRTSSIVYLPGMHFLHFHPLCNFLSPFPGKRSQITLNFLIALHGGGN